MSRLVKDSVVLERIDTLNRKLEYLDHLPGYNGNVETKLLPVRLEDSEIGLEGFSVSEILRKGMDAWSVNESNCRIEYEYPNGEIRVFKISAARVKLLKALAMEQINRNEDYSRVVADAFMQVFQSTIMGVGKVEWKSYDVESPMCQYIHSEIVEFVNGVF